MGLKEFVARWKEDRNRKKELAEIQRDAYYKEMKNQSENMGKKQAEIEARHREKLYTKKLEVIERKKTATITSNGPVDVFGFQKSGNSGRTKSFDVLTGKYGN